MHAISYILLLIGGLNWGLVGLGNLIGDGNNWNVVNQLLGGISWLENIIYLLVGIAAVLILFTHKKHRMMSGKRDGQGGGAPQGGNPGM